MINRGSVIHTPVKKHLLIICIFYYAILCMTNDLYHSHENDLDFHSYCPACQWEIQSNADDVVISEGLTIQNNVQILSYERICEATFLYKVSPHFTCSSKRGPPELT